MRIGPWWIEPYTLRILIGTTAALLCLWLRAPAYGLSRRAAGGWLWGMALAALVSGRAGYVLGNLRYFSQQPHAILRPGGMQGGAALLGSLLVALLWARGARRPFNALLAWLTPAILLIAAGAWWGCASVGCAWGRVVFFPSDQNPWYVTPSPDIYRNVLPRYAVQALGALCALLLAGGALLARARAAAALALYAAAAGALTFLRADPVPLIAGLRVDSLQDVGIAWAILLSLRPRRAAISSNSE